MALKSQETIAQNQTKITFDIDKERFEAAINKVFKNASKNITIPGFRKGKAPRSIVERMYGKGVFYEDAVNDLIPEVYPEVIKEVKKTVVSRPEFDIVSIDENGVVLSATFFTKPTVKIADYFGIEVDRPVYDVTEDDILEELKRVQTRNSRMIDIDDRAAQLEDLVNIDFDGYVDGKQFDGGKSEGHSLKLGSGQFIPGFEDQIVGHKIGDEFDVNVKFPEDYHAEELKGKDATFKCKLNGIKFQELPALDDDFAKDVSEFDTLDEYKADIKTRLEDENKKRSDNLVDEALMNALVEKLDAKIPECMFENETENMVRDYDTRLRMNGLDMKTYFQYTGMTLDSLREQMRPDAEKQVKIRLALEKIASAEKVKAGAKEVEDEYKRLAEQYGMELDKVKEAVEADAIKEDIKVKKAMDAVRENAKINEVKEEKK